MVSTPFLETAARLLFCAALIPAVISDIRRRILPDRITLPCIVLGLAVSFLPGGTTPLTALAGLLTGGGLLYAVGLSGQWMLKREGMGGGDVKLMAAAGAFLGPLGVLNALFLGSLAALLFVLVQTPFKRRFFGVTLAFGPFLAAGIAAALLADAGLLPSVLSVGEWIAQP